MNRKWTVAAAMASLSLVSGPLVRATEARSTAAVSSASEPAATEPESFTATLPAGMTERGVDRTFVFTVERWTSRNEGLALATLQAERGTDAVQARMASSPAGSVRVSPASPSLLPGGWPFGSGEVYAASVLPSPIGGRTVRLLTRMRFLVQDGEKRYGDQLGLLQLELDEKGNGLGGTLIPANVVPLDAEGRLTFDPASFPDDTFELVGVRSFGAGRERTPSRAPDRRGENR